MENNTESKKMTFLKLLKMEGINKIKIPRIQRNYAQGREKEKKVRKEFLNSIFEVLTKNSEKSNELCLDFIFGNVEDGKFIPIDGQQRLTTLFLIYWYIFVREKENGYIQEQLKKFTYETRDTAKEFCEKLSQNSIKETNKQNKNMKKIADKIRNQKWYFLEWDKDPTINSMLLMLNDIEEKCEENRDNIENIRKNLELDSEKIYFYYIEIKNFGIPDELYVKMNSRGKKITMFESFKSKLEEKIKKEEDNKKIADDFSKKIDNEWINYFWNVLKKILIRME